MTSPSVLLSLVVRQVAEENWDSAPLEVVEEPPKKKGLFQDDMDLDERTSHMHARMNMDDDPRQALVC